MTTPPTRTLGMTSARGATLVRSHAQVDTRSGPDRLEGVLAIREAYRCRADVQLVAFPQVGIARDPGTGDLVKVVTYDWFVAAGISALRHTA